MSGGTIGALGINPRRVPRPAITSSAQDRDRHIELAEAAGKADEAKDWKAERAKFRTDPTSKPEAAKR